MNQSTGGVTALLTAVLLRGWKACRHAGAVAAGGPAHGGTRQQQRQLCRGACAAFMLHCGVSEVDGRGTLWQRVDGMLTSGPAHAGPAHREAARI